MTTQVISGTVTSVVTASRGTSGSRPVSGADTTATTVISGKIVTQVTTAILCGGGAAAPGRAGRVNQLSSPVTNWVRSGPATNWVRSGPATCGSARSSHAARWPEPSQARRWAGESNR